MKIECLVLLQYFVLVNSKVFMFLTSSTVAQYVFKTINYK